MTNPAEPSIHHRTLSALPAELRSLPRAELLGLAGSSGAYLAAGLLAAGEPKLAVLAPDQAAAQQFCEALAFYHGRPDEVALFPGWELDPYSPLSPHPDVEAQRLATLTALAAGRLRAVVTTVRAVQQRLIPRAVLENLHLVLQAGREYPRDELLAKLLSLGYQRVPLVEERGSFAVRGDLVDLFPPAFSSPVRLAFFGDELEELRPFEAITQRTGNERLTSLELSPAREMVLAGEHLATYCARVRARCDELELPRSVREALLSEAREGLLAPGREQLLPFNYPGLDTLFDYLGRVRWLVLDPPAVASAADELALLVREGERRQQERGEAFAPAIDFYLSPEELETRLGCNPRLDLAALQVYRLDDDFPLFRVPVQGNGDLRPDHPSHDGTLGYLVARLRDWREDGWRVLLVCHQEGQAERLRDLLEPSGLPLRWAPELAAGTATPPGLTITVGNITDGFRLIEEKLAVITDDEIFGPRVHRRTRRRDRRVFESSLADLRPGHHVVHADYGIARYHGLLHLAAGGTEGDFLHLEFAGDDRLYLPVERIEKVQKYVADGGEPRLDKMGSGSWEKAKLKARAAVEELARDLLHIQARRQLTEGFRYTPPDRLYREFEAAFPYEETPDQLEAIEAVLNDLQSGKPVDRLICGDVGYGKTEVAIRAAFKVVLDGRQVAVLVPTTVLARQHLETFRQRLADFPVTIEMVSRFRTPAEQKAILARTAEGKVDILIGTHRLLQADVRFKDLGLVVVDEEQRFGVAHKERLKKLRAEVDLLTLTATPIPRTLHLSLTGIRDLSIIDTAPVDRQAIRTYVTRFDDDLVRDAILRELKRGGQVYFVHNRVQTIDAMAEFLRTLLPNVRIGVGHGQMNETVLEKAMLDFIEGRIDLLLCTAIIENGLDIARANTIIIDRADTFGLAQLYQLRGRVGRSSVRAYAYLLIPGEGSLTHDARERLRVLQEQTELGAGFRIARHDLELRGAGDLLGARQAGQIAAIGFELYTELLEETVKELQGQVHEARIDPEVRLGLSAYLPEGYVADPNQRLVFYRRMAAAVDEDELYAAGDELRDRFGELPEPAQLLLEVMKLRVLMKQLRIEQAEYDGQQLVLVFPPTTRVTPEQIMVLLARPERYRFSPDYRLSVRLGRLPAEEALAAAKKELRALCTAC
ncbi:MAG: transcription-repair coupling factor [Desulfuromonas sp.]|nr:transcription-repair coupling factor [Desulfuromonas sp.]